jgi:hypothetical protein
LIITDAYYITKAYVVGDVPLFLWGDRGIGKSTLVSDIGKELNMPVVDLRLATQEVADLIGIPYKENGRTIWAAPEWFPDESQPNGILFLDEMNRAQRDVRQAAFQLVLDRKLHTHVLPSGWRIVAAGNYFGAYDVAEMDEAMMSRFGHIDVETNQHAVCAYGVEKHWIPRITDFLRANPKFVMMTPEDSGAKPVETYSAQPDPRRWSFVNKLIKASMGIFPQNEHGEHLIRVALEGLVGVAAAQAFMSYNEAMPSFNDIIHGHVSYKDVEKRFGKSDSKLNSAIEKILQEVVPVLKTRRFSEEEYEITLTFILQADRRDLTVGVLQNIIDLDRSKRLTDSEWRNRFNNDSRMHKFFEHLIKDKNIKLDR